MPSLVVCIASSFLTSAPIARASLAEGWGAPPRRAESGAAEVLLTASGAFQRPRERTGPMMRRHPSEEAASEDGVKDLINDDSVKQGDSKAMFRAMDLDSNGLITLAEIQKNMRDTHSPIPKDLESLVGDIDANGDGSIDYSEFVASARGRGVESDKETSEGAEKASLDKKDSQVHRHHARRHHRHGEKPSHSKLAAAPDSRQHMREGRAQVKQEELLEDASATGRHAEEPTDDDTAEGGTPAPTGVTCGGHRAANCAACPTTNSAGHTVFDHGSEWCHGDCQYHEGACKAGGEVAAEPAVANDAGSAEPVPDLMNPAMTPADKEVANEAAADAIKEQTIEKKEKEKAKNEEKDGFDMGKFWLVVIIIFSVILGICAIVSLIALAVFCLMANPDEKDVPLVGGDEAEDEGEGDEDDGEGES